MSFTLHLPCLALVVNMTCNILLYSVAPVRARYQQGEPRECIWPISSFPFNDAFVKHVFRGGECTGRFYNHSKKGPDMAYF